MLGEQVYEAPQLTLCIKMSVAQRPLIRHRRMNLQHAVQHLLSVSLARLHTNKPAGTRGLTPTWLISTLSLPVRSKPRAKRTCLFTLVDPHIISAECLCSNALLLYEKLEYVNYRFFPEKWDVQIIGCTKFYGIFDWTLGYNKTLRQRQTHNLTSDGPIECKG